MKIHPLCKILPSMSEEEYAALKDDIKEHGLLEPIWLAKDGKLIDGRHRVKACQELKISIGKDLIQETDLETEEDIVNTVLSLNLKRRHLDESQRAMIGAELATQLPGKPKKVIAQNCGIKQPQIAAQLNVSTRSIQSARQVIKQGTEELKRAVRAGSIPVSGAAALSAVSPAQQRKVVVQIEQGEVKTAKDALRQMKLKEQIKAIEKTKPPRGTYQVLVVDPAWKYEKNREHDDTQRGRTDYPPMTETQIASLGIPAAEDCILWLWVTNAHLVTGEASRVLQAWGFEPKTMLTWVKNKMGTGDWLRGKTEHAILAVRGKPKMKPPIPPTVFEAPVGKPSEKPDAFYQLVEKHCPGKKCEMFARKVRKGWTQVGSDLGGIK